MLHFYEIPNDVLFERKFVLDEDERRIGGGTLRWVHGVIEIRDFALTRPQYADLLAASLLNAARNTDVPRVRVPAAPHWERFGLERHGDVWEQDTDKLVFDSVCRSRSCAECADAATCDRQKGDSI